MATKTNTKEAYARRLEALRGDAKDLGDSLAYFIRDGKLSPDAHITGAVSAINCMMQLRAASRERPLREEDFTAFITAYMEGAGVDERRGKMGGIEFFLIPKE